MTPQAELDARADALRAFAASDVPVLVAGAYAFFRKPLTIEAIAGERPATQPRAGRG